MPTIQIKITVRYRDGVWYASCRGSRTSTTGWQGTNEMLAVRKLAVKIKVFPDRVEWSVWNREEKNVKLVKVDDKTWTAEWEEKRDEPGVTKSINGKRLWSGHQNIWGRIVVVAYDLDKELEAMTSPSVAAVIRGIEADNMAEAEAEAARRVQAGEVIRLQEPRKSGIFAT